MAIIEKIEIRFEMTFCWLAFRLDPSTGGISGHYKDWWDGKRYHNTTALNPNQGNVCANCMDDLDEAMLQHLLERATGSKTDFRDEALIAIEQLNQMHMALWDGK
jgi:hypothetical protein|tara:strand:+ start:814 stop:1128 length:315 start_codon:yes stop_codon:yes gene_type:complete